MKDEAVLLTVTGVPLPRASWALVRDGVVAAIVQTYDFVRHPFGEIEQGEIAPGGGHVALTGEHVLRVDGTDAQIGHLVDARGNVTPAEGRTRALLPGETAYQAPVAAQIAPVREAEPEAEPEPGEPEPQTDA